jgi:hypothetical protein
MHAGSGFRDKDWSASEGNKVILVTPRRRKAKQTLFPFDGRAGR